MSDAVNCHTIDCFNEASFVIIWREDNYKEPICAECESHYANMPNRMRGTDVLPLVTR